MTAKRLINRSEARELYLQIFGEFWLEVPTDKTEAARLQQTVDVINSSFLAADGADQTIIRDWVNNEYEGWQCWSTYDSIDLTEAERLFDTAWPEDAKPVRSVLVKTNDWLCYCGCGTNRRSRKTLFAPGHDARFASNLIKDARAGRITKHEAITRATDVSAKLGRKVDDALTNSRSTNGGDPKAVRLGIYPESFVSGTVKRGRWTYPAQRMMFEGKVRMNINDVRDGSGDWLDAEGYDGKTQDYWLPRFTPKA